uniref:HisA/HisF-related TIM barrel protein n=1 Tax=Flavobacterium sp. TaxID=239 RepID=UPI00404AA1C4
MQSRNFRLQKVGNLSWLEKNYKFQYVATSLDELIILNAQKTQKSISDFADTVSKLVNHVFIPIAAGGGIRTLQDAEILFQSGADKIVINSVLVENPDFVKTLVRKYGSQSIVASIDYKNVNGVFEIYINDGTCNIEMSMSEYLKYLEQLEVGELYLNSIDRDGTGFGYDFETINNFKNQIPVPLIIAGGAGNENHLVEGLNIEKVSAVATANLFNFIGNGLINARKEIFTKGINIASWY